MRTIKRYCLISLLVGVTCLVSSCDSGNAPDSSSACVTIDSSVIEQGRDKVDLDVNGTEFNAYNGSQARVLTTQGHDKGYIGIADIEIVDGSFSLHLPQALTDYTGIGLYIDINKNDRCDANEPMWEITNGPATQNEIFEFSPESISLSEPASHCKINGIIGDLTEYLPCSL